MAAGVRPPSDEQLRDLERYFALLGKWNQKINLTALPVKMPTDETFDRLLVEPLIASRHAPDAGGWFDLGSGGGSPAIPLKIVRPELELTMVEAKARKTAFLREVLRTLRLTKATVENSRFEAVASRRSGMARLVTVRALKLDSALVASAAELLEAEGQLFVFRVDEGPPRLPGFTYVGTVPVRGSRPSAVVMYRRMFHVEQSP